jgi:Domain of unknown function (DUF4321)
LALTFFLGILVGSVLGQAIGLFLPSDGVAHQLFVQYESFGFGLKQLDLIIFEISLGFMVHVNLMSVVGIFVVAQLLRWFR